MDSHRNRTDFFREDVALRNLVRDRGEHPHKAKRSTATHRRTWQHTRGASELGMEVLGCHQLEGNWAVARQGLLRSAVGLNAM